MSWTRTNHRRAGYGSSPLPKGNPTTAWSKKDIVAWLAGRGVVLDKKAQTTLSKAELLDLVADVLSPEAVPE
jgi:acyl-CoA reductase-like NAD-dependent aldehyde dehydrogenase